MRRLRGEDGAYAVLYAVLVVVLVGITSVVVDLGMMRNDRRENRAAADSAAIAGAAKLGLSGANPYQACIAAYNYARADLGMPADNVVPAACTARFLSGGFSPASACTAGIPLTAVISLPGNRTLHFTWPVPDGSPLMLDPDHERYSSYDLPDQVASSTQDGSPCLRVGVAITQDRNTPFAAVWDDIDATRGTVSHSVGLAAPDDGPGEIAAPLVVLDEHTCNALTVGGGGGITVQASLPDINGVTTPGVIAMDTDGLAGTPGVTGEVSCGGGRRTISAPSTGNHIWAIDGTAGPAFISSYAIAVGNTVKAYDPNDVLGCDPGDTASLATLMAGAGEICPVPQAGARVTDRPWVLRYNCDESGGVPCYQPRPSDPLPSPRDYVDQWVRFANGPTPQTWGTSSAPGTFRTNTCNVNSVVVFTGDTYVDCPTFRIRASGRVSFMGRVVFSGNIDVDSGSGPGGCLLFNDTDISHCTMATAPTHIPLANRTADGGNVYIAGDLNVAGSLIAKQSFVYLDRRLNISTGDPSVISWVAPYGKTLPAPYNTPCAPASTVDAAPSSACFDSLGLWAPQYAAEPGGTRHVLQGQSFLQVDGTLFLPNAFFYFGGGTVNIQDRAQFVARRLELRGGTNLTMTPDASRSTLIPRGVGKLIR